MGVFTAEHAAFRQTIRSFVDKELVPHVDEWEAAGRFPRSVWRQLGEMGLLGIEFPEKYGGAGADFLHTAVFCEEMARCRSAGVVMGVLATTDMSAPHILNLGTEAQKAAWLPRICRGEAVSAIAVTEPGGGSDVAGLRTRAERRGGEWIVNGSKMFITNGAEADLYVTAVRTAPADADKRFAGISVLLVEKGTPGFTVSRTLDKMGNRSSDTAELSFQDARVPVANLLGTEGRGFYEVMRNFQRERLVAALWFAAASRQALEDTIAYARQREAFGAPISKLQVIRHSIAGMAAQIECLQSFLHAICGRFGAGEECTTEISMAKLLAGDLANRVAYDCTQVFGGYAYMREYPIERFYRDARLWSIGGGTSEIMKEIIAARLEL
ncbi:MAG TPA: acyl-CoA dehydrogenase family protein [Methylomirabilota bacterium]|jgi:acyl-CoA dehydrogenase|nr:acyl-CoA dehydrogenase family protein [Methylomirabilota bacterium]